MKYSLNPNEVKKLIDAELHDRPYDQAQFLFYHLYRNYFNVKHEVTSLTYVRDKIYVDNQGHQWEEQPTLKNMFHMPKTNWLGSMLRVSNPYSRKFLRDDNVSGIGGEFEMIIRHDGKRIDALTHEGYQETYNFGRTKDAKAHKLLDVDTHMTDSNYTFKQNMGRVKIIERQA